jgi:hypothetical protein
VGGADAGAPFYRVGGGAGRPGVGEERWRRYYGIMMMKAAVSEGDQAGSDEGGVLRPLWERKGEGHREAAAHARASSGGVMAERPKEEDEGVGPARH